MSRKLYEAVIAELNDLQGFLWLTPYLAKRQVILQELKAHLEAGDPLLAPFAALLAPIS